MKITRRNIRLAIAVAVGLYVLASGVYRGLAQKSDNDQGGVSNAPREETVVDMLSVGMPEGLKSQIRDYTGFRVSFNKDRRTPNWVAWELSGARTEGPSKRSNRFWQDYSVEGCSSVDDYRKSGFDRGHMCPAAEQKWSEEAMRDCFVFANICPQDRALNSGAWNALENKERAWAKRDSAIVIIAGPIYDRSAGERSIGNGVRVPDAFFKILAAPWIDKPRGIAFVYPNMHSPGNMQTYVMTIDQVEKITGYDFFEKLPDDLENEIESKASFREWNRR